MSVAHGIADRAAAADVATPRPIPATTRSLSFESSEPIDDLLSEAFRHMLCSHAVRGRPRSLPELAASLGVLQSFAVEGLLFAVSSTCRRLRDDVFVWLRGTPQGITMLLSLAPAAPEVDTSSSPLVSELRSFTPSRPEDPWRQPRPRRPG